MDIENLAAVALTTALSYVAKGGEEIAKGVGKDLWELIKKPFTKDRDKALLHTLEQNPDDVKTKNIAEYKLREFLEDNPALVRELEELYRRMPDSSQQKNNIQIVKGANNVAINGMINSTFTNSK
jgi:hypothetical protein